LRRSVGAGDELTRERRLRGQVSGFGFRVSGFEVSRFQVSGFDVRCSIFEVRCSMFDVSRFKPALAHGAST
jgi:hypothetical protein